MRFRDQSDPFAGSPPPSFVIGVADHSGPLNGCSKRSGATCCARKLADSRPNRAFEGWNRAIRAGPQKRSMQRKNAILHRGQPSLRAPRFPWRQPARHRARRRSVADAAQPSFRQQVPVAVRGDRLAPRDARRTRQRAAVGDGRTARASSRCATWSRCWIRIGFETAAASRRRDVPATDGARDRRSVRGSGPGRAREARRCRARLHRRAAAVLSRRPARYAAASAYIYVSASLLKFLVGSKRLFRLAQAGAPHGCRSARTRSRLDALPRRRHRSGAAGH